MKKIKTILFISILGLVFSLGIHAQPPPPQDPASGGNQSPYGGPAGSPLGPGTGIMLVLAAVYGFKNLHERMKKKKETGIDLHN